MCVLLRNLPHPKRERNCRNLASISKCLFNPLWAVYNWSEVEFFFLLFNHFKLVVGSLSQRIFGKCCLAFSFISSLRFGAGSLLLPVFWYESMHYLYIHSTNIYWMLTIYYAYDRVLVSKNAFLRRNKWNKISRMSWSWLGEVGGDISETTESKKRKLCALGITVHLKSGKPKVLKYK